MLTFFASLIVASLFGLLALVLQDDLDAIMDNGASATLAARFVLVGLLPSLILFAVSAAIAEGTESTPAKEMFETVRRAVRAVLFGKAVA